MKLPVLLLVALSLQAHSEEPIKRFDFGPGAVASGYTQVNADAVYSAEVGWGFEPGAEIKGVDRGGDPLTGDHVACDRTFYFSVALPEGAYRVTATLGDTDGVSSTTIKSELRRLALVKNGIPTGRPAKRSFLVHVRRPDIPGGSHVKLKDREKTNEIWGWDEKLTLEISGLRHTLAALEITPAPNVPVLHLMGDSTVADQPSEPYASWGQMMPSFFDDQLLVVNHAQSGDSLRSAYGANRLAKVISLLHDGDYVAIQFGHNDEKDKTPGAGAFTTYKEMLKRYVTEIKAAKGRPILLTPVHRRTFDEHGQITNSHGDYPAAVRQVAEEEKVPLIDLLNLSEKLYEAYGPEGSGILFAPKDGTHHNSFGAFQLGHCVLLGLKELNHPLIKYFRSDLPAFDPVSPLQGANLQVPPSPEVRAPKPLGD